MGDTYYVDNTVEFRVTSTCSTTGADTIDSIGGSGSIAVGDPLRLNVSGSAWEIFRFVADLGGGEWQLNRNHGISYPSSGVSIKYGIYDGKAQEPSGNAGPFPTIARALAAAGGHDMVNIKKNSGYTLDNVDQIAESISPTSSGDVALNVKVRVRGFNQTPGDMDTGGAYYHSAYEAYLNGIDSDSIVDVDGNGGALSVMEIDAKENIEFGNLYLHNTDRATGHLCICILNLSKGLLFDHCFFDDASRALATSDGNAAPVDGTIVRDCYVGPDFVKIGTCVRSSGVMNFHIGNVADGVGLQVFGSGGIINNLAVGGGNILTGNGSVYIRNNTVYNCTGSAIFLHDAGAMAIVSNNILVPQQSGNAIKIYVNGGSVRNDYNCIWGADGNQLTTPFTTSKAGGTAPVLGGHSIEVDPEFVNPGGGDFRPRNPLVLRGGQPDVAGNPTQMGMIIQRYQFAQRARMVNLGRIGIIK
jgi:hypothetical protein